MSDKAWIQTFSGKAFHPLDPKVEDICIEDIAHALSQICRFTGNCRKFYSVAQHSNYVSQLVAPENAMWGLLHDASEAYIADVSHPVKHTAEMANYRAIEKGLMFHICKKFGLSLNEPKDVSKADQILLFTEKRDLMGPSPRPWRDGPAPMAEKIIPWGPEQAEAAFLARYKALGGK